MTLQGTLERGGQAGGEWALRQSHGGSGPQGVSFGLSWEWTNSGECDPEKPPW